jgi:hypothetical protein
MVMRKQRFLDLHPFAVNFTGVDLVKELEENNCKEEEQYFLVSSDVNFFQVDFFCFHGFGV